MRVMSLFAGAFALTLLGAPIAAAQETAPAAGFTVEESCTAAAPTEESDQAIVDAAIADGNARGYPGLREHLGALRGVAERAPACYPEMSRQG